MKNHFKVFGIITLVLAAAFLIFSCSSPGSDTPSTSYGIELKNGDVPLTAYTFVEGLRTPLTVTVVNTGTAATGELSITITGDDASAFALSETSISDIAKDDNKTFTVAPHGTLTGGQTYTATITVSGGNNITKSFTVSFKESSVPIYSIALMNGDASLTAYTFDEGIRNPLTVTVKNDGNQAIEVLTIMITGNDSSAFSVSVNSITNIPVDGSETFTVAPHGTLTGGQTYNAIITVSGSNDISENFTVSFKESSDPTYGIALKNEDLDLSDHTFTSRESLLVTVVNTGNQPTGALTITIDGTDASAFTVSETSIDNIAVSSSVTFTVAPHGELTGGQSYNATIKVNGGNNINGSFSVSFTESATPTYGVALEDDGVLLTAYVFTGDNTPLTVTVENTGNTATGTLNIGITGSNASSFTVSKNSITNIAVDGHDTFTVGLTGTFNPGTTYTATITVNGGNGITASFTVSYTLYILNGLWYNEAVIKGGGPALGFGTQGSNGIPGVCFFDDLAFWTLNSWGDAYKGTFSITGNNTTGSYTMHFTNKKNESSSYNWAADNQADKTGTWTLSNGGNTLTIVIPTGNNLVPTTSLVLTRTAWNAPENNAGNKGPWQMKINDPALNSTVPLPPSSVDNAAIDGLWVNLAKMTGSGGDGSVGVWVFSYPNYWSLNNWGYAYKGTYAISGTLSDTAYSGTYNTSQTRKKDNTTSYNWSDVAATDSKTWSLSISDDTLTIGGVVFVRTSWKAPENAYHATNYTGTNDYNGPWQTKIGDSALYPVMFNDPNSSFERFQVHTFTNGTDIRLNSRNTGNDWDTRETNALRLNWRVNNGVWEIYFKANMDYNDYAVIDLHNILTGRNITDLKGVYYRYKISTPVNGVVTYVRDRSVNSPTFNLGALPETTEWTEVYRPMNGRVLITADNAGPPVDGRRTSFGVQNNNASTGTAAGYLYITEYYFFF
jgi:uncharacterized membrane protein